jgi:hypothetical protein
VDTRRGRFHGMRFQPGFRASPAAAAGGALLLDAYPTASFGYSFRKLRAAYAGSAVRIRRSSDNAEADIGFSGNNFDTASAATHIGGGSGFIVTWYDQSGNALDITNSTSAEQPTYNATGLASKPALSVDGGDYLARASVGAAAFGTGSEYSLFIVQIQNSSQGQNTSIGWNLNAARINLHATYDDTIYSDFGDGGGTGRVSSGQPGSWDNNPFILETYRETGGTQGITTNGSSLVTASRSATLTGTDTLTIGAQSPGTIQLVGLMSEVVFWGTDLGASNRTGARTNINTYYAIF